MDGATIQGKVYYGYKQAALRVGLPFNQFRPAPGAPPTDLMNMIGSVLAVMSVATSSNFNFARPGLEEDFLFACLVDGTLVQIGDVLQNPDTGLLYLIAGMAPLMPIVAIRCNALFTFAQRSTTTPLVAGLNPYQGPSLANETDTLLGIPGCIMLSAVGKSTHGSGLPSDAPGPLKYKVHLSPLVDQTMINIDDSLLDDTGRRLQVTGFEKTAVSFRLDTVHLIA
jgi:hypothetical protein